MIRFPKDSEGSQDSSLTHSFPQERVLAMYQYYNLLGDKVESKTHPALLGVKLTF